MREASTPYKVIFSKKIRTEPLKRILHKHLPAGQTIDFLSIDVEGLDYQVLSSNDWKLFRPGAVLIEALDYTSCSAGCST